MNFGGMATNQVHNAIGNNLVLYRALIVINSIIGGVRIHAFAYQIEQV